MSNSKLNLSLSENDWQIILDSLSNTVFNEDIAEGSRKRAKELFLKLQKEIPKTTEAFTMYYMVYLNFRFDLLQNVVTCISCNHLIKSLPDVL